jgi:hypothetical protein
LRRRRYFIEITQDQEVARMQKKIKENLIDQLWIDPQTRRVELRWAACKCMHSSRSFSFSEH